MKFVTNPHLVGVSILVFEWLTNFTISKIFNFDLGENNLSAVFFFIGAGYLIAFKTKEKMSRSYNIKVIATYFLIISLLVFASFLGEEINSMGIVLMLGLFPIYSLACYFAITLGEHIFLKTVKSTAEAGASDGSNNNENV